VSKGHQYAVGIRCSARGDDRRRVRLSQGSPQAAAASIPVALCKALTWPRSPRRGSCTVRRRSLPETFERLDNAKTVNERLNEAWWGTQAQEVVECLQLQHVSLPSYARQAARRKIYDEAFIRLTLAFIRLHDGLKLLHNSRLTSSDAECRRAGTCQQGPLRASPGEAARLCHCHLILAPASHSNAMDRHQLTTTRILLSSLLLESPSSHCEKPTRACGRIQLSQG